MELLNVNITCAGYEDRSEVIKDIVFSIREGELIGLIGPNGAGKSTTIKAVLGLIKHMEGEILFSGLRKNYGYIPEQPIFYDELTLWEHLELAASAFEIKQADFQKIAESLLIKFRLLDNIHQYPAGFSKGMQQKMMLILTFLIKPDIYIIDEPFIGLDPHATKDFLDFLNEERHRGAGVLMSTHVLDTAEKICDSFLLINSGNIVAKGNLREIQRQCNLSKASSLFECFHSLI